MKTMRYLFASLVFLFIVTSVFGADLSTLPPEMQQRRYLLELAEANNAGDNVKVVAVCEKMLSMTGSSVDPGIRVYYAKALAAIGKSDQARKELLVFLNTPGADPELADEALKLSMEFEKRETEKTAQGMELYNQKKYKDAIAALLPMAENSLEAQRILADSYNNLANNARYDSKIGDPQTNFKEAEKWYRKAAERGDPKDQWAAANFYFQLQMQLFGKDKAEYNRVLKSSFEWHLKAASQGYADSFGDVGIAYLSGNAVERDLPEAMKWLRKDVDAGGRGAPLSKVYIGMLYRRGAGVAQDSQEAIKWYKAAAETGRTEALLAIGEMYEKGEGLPQDYRAAAEWYKKAKDKGDKEADSALQRIAPLVK